MHVKNAIRINRLDGRGIPGTTLRTGRKQRQLVLGLILLGFVGRGGEI
jgi:hypothetical protein